MSETARTILSLARQARLHWALADRDLAEGDHSWARVNSWAGDSLANRADRLALDTYGRRLRALQ